MIIRMKPDATGDCWEAVFARIGALGRAYRVVGMRSIAVEESKRGEIEEGHFRGQPGVQSACSMKTELPRDQSSAA